MRFAAFVFITIACAPSIGVAQAQVATAGERIPTAGSRVRVTSIALGGERVTGTLVSATRDSIIFQPTGLVTRTAVRTSDVTRLEVSSGSHKQVGRGMLYGFLIGAASAALIESATWEKTSGFDFGRGGDAAIVAVPGGLIGAVVGAIVGARTTETWQTVPIPGR